MGRMLYILFMLLLVCQTAVGQKVGEPVWGLEMCGEASTNHNASVRLVDSVAKYVFDSLRKDGTAAIVTVYETDEDSVVGLWKMGSGFSERQLKFCRQFYRVYPNGNTLRSQLNWSQYCKHNEL